MIYLDNNATTIMPPEVVRAMVDWCNRGNPSSGYASARESRAMMTKFRVYIGSLCGFNPCCQEPRDGGEPREDSSMYKILFTSGASEANCTAVSSVVAAYAEATGRVPHVVCSAIEHKSIISMVESYERRGRITATYVQPRSSGHILAEDVAAAIKPNTAIVCVMHANNETGAINNIREIGAVAHRANVPYHCDTAQTFGKFPVNPLRDNIDTFCISFHKLHGPPGVGALVIKQQLLHGYKLEPVIFGTQNEGYRGGTENLPGIGASFAATKLTMKDRARKNTRMLELKKYITQAIPRAGIPVVSYKQYLNASKKNALEVVVISDNTNEYLPNTLFLSVVSRVPPRICNGKLKCDLDAKGIVISVGSACNTASSKASHVLYAMGADPLIKAGALRITLGDSTTTDDVKKFTREFVRAINNQVRVSPEDG